VSENLDRTGGPAPRGSAPAPGPGSLRWGQSPSGHGAHRGAPARACREPRALPSTSRRRWRCRASSGPGRPGRSACRPLHAQPTRDAAHPASRAGAGRGPLRRRCGRGWSPPRRTTRRMTLSMPSSRAQRGRRRGRRRCLRGLTASARRPPAFEHAPVRGPPAPAHEAHMRSRDGTASRIRRLGRKQAGPRHQGERGGVFGLRDTVARCLGLEALAGDPPSPRTSGGSFGAKNHTYPEYILAAAISRLPQNAR